MIKVTNGQESIGGGNKNPIEIDVCCPKCGYFKIRRNDGIDIWYCSKCDTEFVVKEINVTTEVIE